MNQTITDLDAAQLCRQLQLLTQAGVELGEGLFLMQEQEDDPALAAIYAHLAREVMLGAPLSAALAGAGCFPHYFTALVEVGERTGRVEQALHALEEHYTRRSQRTLQVKNALTYPAILLVVMGAVILVLLTRVLPVFEEIYASLGGELTGVAGGLALLGRVLRAGMPLLLALLCALGALAGALYLSGSLRGRALSLWREHWGDRGTARAFSDARFAQGMALGLGSGLMAEEAAQLAGSLVQDTPGAYRRAQQCLAGLAEGESLSRSMTGAGLLSQTDARMLELGVRSGHADQVMEQVAAAMDARARQRLEDTIARIEPAMVVCTSVLVGAILLSVMLPLMRIMNAVG